MHLTEARLAEADQTPDERAHLQSCVRCRVAARRLNTFLDDTPPSMVVQEAQRYVVVRSLGVGGMSQVVLSVDSRLGREVARKKLRTVTSARDIERFVREANITARLEHPNIVPVYDLEVDPQGIPTLTMRVVRGKSLGEAMRTGALSDRRARLEVFLKVCDAVAFAHSRGVVHRDLKPDNVMVGEFGEVQVVDFGLAAQEVTEVDATLGGSGSAVLTRSGTVMGTPAYMSPEQARGEIERVGPASDVYGLGATLWEICSGRPPFVGEADAVVAQVALGRVPSPKDVDPSVPEDLAAIVLRAMATDPRDRYPDVSALRRDVVSFLEHAPVSARVPTIADRLAHWFARNRATVMPVAATAVLALLVLIAGLLAWAQQATTARDELARQVETSETARIRVNLEAGSRALIRDEPIEALPYFAQVLRLVEGTEQERDARARLRSAFERVPHIVTMARCEPWSSVDLSMPTGRIAAAGREISVWDSSGKKLRVAGPSSGDQPQIVAWSPDGAALAIASTVDVEIRRAEDLALLSEPLTGSGEGGGMFDLWWSREGDRIFSNRITTSTLRANDGVTAESIDAWRTPPDVEVVGLSPSGIVGRGVPLRDGLRPLALYDIETGRKLRDLVDVEKDDNPFPRASAGDVAVERPSGVVDIIPLAPPDLRQSVRHTGGIYNAAFSPDGRLLATASHDGTAGVWDTRTGSGVIPFLPHLDQVIAVSFPDNQYLITASADGLVRVWHLPPDVGEQAGANAAIAVDASDRFALVPEGQNLSCEDLHDGRTLGRMASPPNTGQPVQRVAFDATGRWASVNWSSALGALLDVESCRILTESSYRGGVWNPAVSIFLGESLTEDFLWTPERGKQPRPKGHPSWSPDGRKVALADSESIRIWDPATGDARTIFEGSCDLVAWGASIAAGCQDGVRLIDPDTGRLLRKLSEIVAVGFAWSPDGRRLAVGDTSGLVKVWDIATGARLAATTVPVAPSHFLGFSEDGQYLAGRGFNRGAWTVWNASTAELVVRLPFGASTPPTLTPSGIIVGLKIPADDLTVADWLDVAELYSLQRGTEMGVDIPTPERVFELWRGLAERDPADFRFDASAVAP